METIVVGVDGSPAAFTALQWADQIAQRTSTRMVVVRAGLEPTRSQVSDDLHTRLADDARRELEGWCKDRELAVAPTALVVHADPRTALITVATDEKADLLAIGATGTSRLAGLFLGGVAHHLASHPTLPLAIVPAEAPLETRHIIIGVDGSPGSLAAVQFCAGVVAGLGVPVTAVLAQEPFAEWVPTSDPASWQRRARRQLRDWVTPLIKAGATVEIVVDRDIQPVAALTRVVEQHPGSVVVVGNRGRGGFPGLRLGRVPLHVVQHAHVPVIIVPTVPA